jgi:hypothetical protein
MKILIIYLQIFVIFTLVCCSSSTIYISPEYEDKTHTNVSIDTFYPEFRERQGTDTIYNAYFLQFQKALTDYFPFGIKLFSSFNRVNIILYEQEDKYPPTYNLQINAEKNEILDLPDSIKNLCAKSKSDFFLLFHNFGWSVEYKNNKNEMDGFVTRFHFRYSLWDSNNGILISYGKKKFQNESQKLGSGWPYKNSLLKLAYEIFKDLPMFFKK